MNAHNEAITIFLVISPAWFLWWLKNLKPMPFLSPRRSWQTWARTWRRWSWKTWLFLLIRQVRLFQESASNDHVVNVYKHIAVSLLRTQHTFAPWREPRYILVRAKAMRSSRRQPYSTFGRIAQMHPGSCWASCQFVPEYTSNQPFLLKKPLGTHLRRIWCLDFWCFSSHYGGSWRATL